MTSSRAREREGWEDTTKQGHKRAVQPNGTEPNNCPQIAVGTQSQLSNKL